jgi:hypothetical protein
MAQTTVSTTSVTAGIDSGQDYRRPLAMVTTLFFMWGFLTSLNDILIPHLKTVFDLNYAKAMLIQFAFFTSCSGLQEGHGGGLVHDGAWCAAVHSCG